MDINLTRSLTVSPKNFETLKPSVSITVKDVDISKLSELYPEYEKILNNLFHLELMNEYVIHHNISKKGLNNFIMDLIKNKIDTIQNSLENSVDNIIKIEGKSNA